jgi:hypothetical protein
MAEARQQSRVLLVVQILRDQMVAARRPLRLQIEQGESTNILSGEVGSFCLKICMREATTDECKFMPVVLEFENRAQMECTRWVFMAVLAVAMKGQLSATKEEIIAAEEAARLQWRNRPADHPAQLQQQE